MSERTARRRHRSTPSPGMMKLSVASQATSPSTLATPRPRPKRAAELLHRDLEPEGVARDDDPLEARVVDAGEQPDPVAEARLLGDVDRHRLGERLDLEDARHDRQAREVALEEPLGRGDALDPDDPLRLGVVLDDPVDEQERPAMRDQRLDLAGRVDRGGWRVGRRASCAGRWARVIGSGRRRRAAERGRLCAGHASRAGPGGREEAPALARRGRAGSSSSGPRGTSRCRAGPGGSATLVTRPSTTQLVERDPAAGDGGRPVRAPDDELAEQRVVERRDLVAGVQVRVHPDARAARREVPLDEPGARAEVGARGPRR